MADFNKIDTILGYIDKGALPEGQNFNDFAIEFFNETKTLTLSTYIKLRGFEKKIPKIMNTKKAGEILIDTEKSDEIKTFLARKGYKEPPQLSYKSIMLLRKVNLYDNWQRILHFIEGKKSIKEINQATKRELLPIEVERLENFVKKSLKISDEELNWLLDKINKIDEDSEVKKAMKKLSNY